MSFHYSLDGVIELMKRMVLDEPDLIASLFLAYQFERQMAMLKNSISSKTTLLLLPIDP